MKTLTKPRSRFLHREHFAVSRNPKLVGQWQHGIETIVGTRAMEIASHVRAFAVTSLRDS